MEKGIVYICHHIDTEGPLWEIIEELFNRLDLIFGIKLEPTYENLKLLQEGKIEVPDEIKESLALTVDPHTVGFKRNWGMIEEMLYRIMSKDFRNQMLDSFGGGWVYNWHIMDHVGFGNVNPRHRDYGYHNVLDCYKYMIKVTGSDMDAIHWHFHPIPFRKEANIPATSYDNSMPVILDIITHRLLDRDMFPVVNRAGFHTERIDANFFLEQWMPFDPSCQSVDADHQPTGQRDLIDGRYGDWRNAPSDWSLYHPDFYDWRKPGNMHRWLARILNMKSRHRNITVEEIEKAFVKAENGENVYLGITDHDWREMSVEVDDFREKLQVVIERHPDVKFKFSETVDAFRHVIGYSKEEIEKNKLSLKAAMKENILHVEVQNGELFGPQPYLAIKTKCGEYFHDNFDFQETGKSFSYVFDAYTIPVDQLECVKVAGNDKYGNQCIVDVEL